MGDDKSVGECFQYNQDTRRYVEAVEERHGYEIKDVRDELKDLVQMLANRLPVWATLLIAVLTALVSGLLVKAVMK